MEHNPCRDRFGLDTLLQGPEFIICQWTWGLQNDVEPIKWLDQLLSLRSGGRVIAFCIISVLGFYPFKAVRVTESELGGHINVLK